MGGEAWRLGDGLRVLGVGLVILLAAIGLSVTPLCLLLAVGLAVLLWHKWPLPAPGFFSVRM